LLLDGNAKFAIGFLPQQMVKFTCLSAVGVLGFFLCPGLAARCDQQQQMLQLVSGANVASGACGVSVASTWSLFLPMPENARKV